MSRVLGALDGARVGGATLVATADADAVYAIRRAAFAGLVVEAAGAWDDAALRARFEAKWHPDGAYRIVGERGDLGTLELAYRDADVFVTTIALLPSAQGAGLGSAVIRAVQAAAAAEGREVALSVTRPNRRAAALYPRLGFVVEKVDDERTWMRWTGAPVRTPGEVVREFHRAFAARDLAALADLYAADAVNHQVAEAPVIGRDAIVAGFAAFFRAFPEETTEPVGFYEDGEWGIWEWRGGNPTLPPDAPEILGCGFFRVRGGKIVLQRGYWDRLTFLRAHGLPVGED
jgi:ribosomal protein S18 acetylase RimI-like enzyme/ketosteroid isomerase-like protein